MRTWRETLGLLKKKLRLLSFSWIQTGECWTFFCQKSTCGGHRECACAQHFTEYVLLVPGWTQGGVFEAVLKSPADQGSTDCGG